MSQPQLPAQFRGLEPFIDWAIPRERQRTAKRLASSMDEITALYNAVFPQLEAIIAYLNQFPVKAMPPDAERLSHLALSLVEVANLVELYKRPGVMDAMDPARFVSHE